MMVPFKMGKLAYAFDWWSMEFPSEAEEGVMLLDLQLSHAQAHIACGNLPMLERLWGERLDFYMESFEEYFGVQLTRRAARMHLRKFLRENAG